MLALVHEVASDIGYSAKKRAHDDSFAAPRACAMTDRPLNLDKHRSMAAQKATDLWRTLMEAENSARELREVCRRLVAGGRSSSRSCGGDIG
jgi:hypothetical protein